MKVLCYFLFAAFAFTAAHGREWTDTSGRIISATLVGINKHSVILRISGGREIRVPREKLSEADKLLLTRYETHKRTANRIHVLVTQATNDGALCAVYIKTIENVPTKKVKYEIGLDGPTYVTVNVPTPRLAILHEVAFIHKLTTVKDGESLDLIAWTAGHFDYESVGAGPRRVPAYQLDPPEGEVAIEAGDFGT